MHDTHDRRVTELRGLAFHKDIKFQDKLQAAEEDV
jgi:hypothetical protein